MNHREQVIEILSQPSYLDLPAEYLRPSLTGRLFHQRAQDHSEQTNFHVFDPQNAGFPWRSDGDTMIAQITPLLGKDINQERARSLVKRCFRTDLYREAAQLLNIDCPYQDYRIT